MKVIHIALGVQFPAIGLLLVVGGCFLFGCGRAAASEDQNGGEKGGQKG
jgi:hypothetical protein